jgi:hypothetical protein
MGAFEITGAVVAALFLLWVLANLKTSRPDGEHIGNLHKYRTMMFYVMPTRNESVVYFDEYIDAENLLNYIKDASEAFGISVGITHCVVGCASLGFSENPPMNKFVSGYRLYQRKGIFLSFSMKRKRLNKKAKLAVVKQELREDHTFRTMCEEIDGKINVERSGKKTYADKEYDYFTAIPRPVLLRLFDGIRQLNHYNLLPGWFIEPDPMHTSMFIANLGSVNMRAGYHHLYEWGTCPLFVMVGKVEDRAVVIDGEVVVRPQLHVRFSYDERIDDGMTASFGIQSMKETLEDPYGTLGCIEPDGSDAWLMSTPREERESAIGD